MTEFADLPRPTASDALAMLGAAEVQRLLATPAPQRRSLYLTMRDGVRIAVTIWLPADPPAHPVPTVIEGTRYWRAVTDAAPAEMLRDVIVRKIVSFGVAFVGVDARGTGASFGTWQNLWSSEERQDLLEVVDWVTQQPWSDGGVSSFGTSYAGFTAHLLAASGHRAVRAVVPRFSALNLYDHGCYPGGVQCEMILRAWTALNRWLDTGEATDDLTRFGLDARVTGSVLPADDDTDGAQREAARLDHADNLQVWAAHRDVIFSDDMLGTDGLPVESNAPGAHLAAICEHKVPVWLWTGWYDGGFAASALEQVNRGDLDVVVTIGPWAHGALHPMNGSQFATEDAPLDPPYLTQLDEVVTFLLDRHHDRPCLAPRLRFYTLGAERWQEADCWPPPGVQEVTTYLGSGHTLTPQPAVARSRSVEPDRTDDAYDSYDVDYTASTGLLNRWGTIVGGTPPIYGDRSGADEKTLNYTGDVLDSDVEVTGTPAVRLWLSTTRDDGAIHAYLEDVAPDGRVTYVTEGMLRFLHRRVQGTGGAGHNRLHSFLRRDASPVHPDGVMELHFEMLPVSVVFREGHRIRLSLAGADTPTFARLPAQGAATWKVHHTVDMPSQLTLPVRSSSPSDR